MIFVLYVWQTKTPSVVKLRAWNAFSVFDLHPLLTNERAEIVVKETIQLLHWEKIRVVNVSPFFVYIFFWFYLILLSVFLIVFVFQIWN